MDQKNQLQQKVMHWSWRFSAQQAWMAQWHQMLYSKRHVSSTTNQDEKKQKS
jgi:hypothetical protein